MPAGMWCGSRNASSSWACPDLREREVPLHREAAAVGMGSPTCQGAMPWGCCGGAESRQQLVPLALAVSPRCKPFPEPFPGVAWPKYPDFFFPPLLPWLERVRCQRGPPGRQAGLPAQGDGGLQPGIWLGACAFPSAPPFCRGRVVKRRAAQSRALPLPRRFAAGGGHAVRSGSFSQLLPVLQGDGNTLGCWRSPGDLQARLRAVSCSAAQLCSGKGPTGPAGEG